MAEKKLEDIIFNEWQKGIGPSPYLGYADMQNVNIEDKPGVLMCGLQATKESGTTITNLPTWIVINPSTGNHYALDTDGKLYKSTDDGDTWALVSGNTLPSAGAGGQGLAIWKSYLFVARASTLDVMKISDETWTNGWQTVDTDSDFHPMIATQDDKLTGGAGRYIFTVAEAAGQTFAPGNGATFTFTAQKLTLPALYKVKCLAELGLDLKIGTWIGSNLTDVKGGVIFGWDRVSTSYAGSRTIFISENGINSMIAVSGRLYFVAGVRSNLYVTGGGPPQLIAEWKSIDFPFGSHTAPRPGAIAYHKGKIIIGLSAGSSASPMGIYSYNITTGAKKLENAISAASTASNIVIGAIFSVNDQIYLIGWQQSTAQGIDMVGNSGYRVTSYGAYVDTDFRRVGLASEKRTTGEIHITLGRDLAANQGVRVKYRKALDDAFTTLGTYDHDTYGAVHEIVMGHGIADMSNVQLRIELTTGSSDTTTPELEEIRLR